MSVTIVVNFQASEGNGAKLLALLTGPPDNGVVEAV